MKPWFRDLPLDFSRDDTRSVERILVQAYPMNLAALQLATDAGLNVTRLNQMATAQFLMRDILEKAAAADRLTRLLAEVFRDPDKEAFQKLIQPFVAGYEAELEAAILRERPSLATLRAVPPSIEVWKAGASPRRLAEPSALEQVLNVAAGFADVLAFRRSLVIAEVRTARIVVGGHPTGTGFLVGDSLMLTNWHVAKSAAHGASAQFDHKMLADGREASSGRSVSFAEDWDVAHSGHVTIPEELGVDGPPKGSWDYALIRLAEPVGAQSIGAQPSGQGDVRGHFILDDGRYFFVEEEPIIILGHPKGRPMQMSWAAPSKIGLTRHASRVRYQTNTEGGLIGLTGLQQRMADSGVASRCGTDERR